MEDIKVEVLEYLFKQYQESPTRIFDFTTYAKRFDTNINKLGSELEDSLFIRDYQIVAGMRPRGRITLMGIEAVDSAYVADKTHDIIEALVQQGGKGNIVAILGVKYGIAFDFAEELKDAGYISIMRRYPVTSIDVELTEYGSTFYEESKADFTN